MPAAPKSFEITVPPAWLDYNNHMNVAYYSLAFDEGGEAFVKSFGMGLEYTQRTQNSWMVLEAHLTYQNEARLGDVLRIETRVLDFNEKLAHLYQEMFRGDQLLATQEQMTLHVSLETRRGAPFPPDILAQLKALHAEQADLPTPKHAGRRIAIKKPDIGSKA
jgi:acyl-CoA thioester hydrolase